MKPYLLTVFFVVLASSGARSQEFTPFELEDMVKSAFSGCMRTQTNLQANAGASRKLLEDYCRCSANRIAAQTTRAEVDASEQNNGLASAALIAKSQRIGQECRAEVTK